MNWQIKAILPSKQWDTSAEDSDEWRFREPEKLWPPDETENIVIAGFVVIAVQTGMPTADANFLAITAEESPFGLYVRNIEIAHMRASGTEVTSADIRSIPLGKLLEEAVDKLAAAGYIDAPGVPDYIRALWPKHKNFLLANKMLATYERGERLQKSSPREYFREQWGVSKSTARNMLEWARGYEAETGARAALRSKITGMFGTNAHDELAPLKPQGLPDTTDELTAKDIAAAIDGQALSLHTLTQLNMNISQSIDL